MKQSHCQLPQPEDAEIVILFPPVQLKYLKLSYPPHTKRSEGFPSPAEQPTSRKIKFQRETTSYNLYIYIFFLELKAAPGNGVMSRSSSKKQQENKN